jgi:GMP reductase
VTPGDVAKAFGAGSDFVMLGGMLSGYDECEGEWTLDAAGNKTFLNFYGMSSKEAMAKFNGGQASYRASEGRSVKVPYRGSVENTVNEILGGLRSACTYVGTESLKDFSKCCTFIRVNNTHNRVFEN